MIPTGKAVLGVPFLALALLMLGGQPLRSHEGHMHAAPGERMVFPEETLVPPNVPVTDRFGRSQGFIERYGGRRLLLISFTYASCTTVCPVANAVLKGVETGLAEAGDPESGLTILTISIDPERDTPAVMTASAETFEAGPNWEWLAASPQETPLLLSAFGIKPGALEDHDPVYLLGDLQSNSFRRVVGLPDPSSLVELVRSYLSRSP